jgi:hypothetical protein
MTTYRLRFLNAAGRSFRGVDLDCPDDASAIARADRYARGRPMELWSGARVVKAYPATTSV